jgi:hypothetical protein
MGQTTSSSHINILPRVIRRNLLISFVIFLRGCVMG